MTDNPQIDPRLLAARQFLDEYAAALSRTSPGPRSHAARMLELLDAADEASGVRRVRITAADVPHIARKSDLVDGSSRALCGASVTSAVETEGPVCGLCVLICERAEALGWLPPLADSPVGGVS